MRRYCSDPPQRHSFDWREPVRIDSVLPPLLRDYARRDPRRLPAVERIIAFAEAQRDAQQLELRLPRSPEEPKPMIPLDIYGAPWHSQPPRYYFPRWNRSKRA
jgi:hypothetical protein